MLLCIRRLVERLLAGQPLPKHVAFIMDGNRRFADQLQLQRIDGHKHGYAKMKAIIQWCLDLGITHISVYAFSIDNFKRSQEEVDSLMELAEQKFDELLHDEDAKKWQAEVCVIGDLSRAPPAIQQAAARLMQGSRENGPTKAVVNICFSYTSTEELQHAMHQAASSSVNRSDSHEDIRKHNSTNRQNNITADLLFNMLYTSNCPPVDILIRTSGQQRLSDFLLWQSSNALLHWEPCLWPEFGYVHLLRALLTWQKAAPHLRASQQLQQEQQQQQQEPNRKDASHARALQQQQQQQQVEKGEQAACHTNHIHAAATTAAVVA